MGEEGGKKNVLTSIHQALRRSSNISGKKRDSFDGIGMEGARGRSEGESKIGRRAVHRRLPEENNPADPSLGAIRPES